MGSRGEDHILWGRWQKANTQEELQAKEKKRKKPPTSNKQTKKWGIPLRKEKKGEMETKTHLKMKIQGKERKKAPRS